MANISPNLRKSIGRSASIPNGTDLIEFLKKMHSDDEYFVGGLATQGITNFGSLPDNNQWWNFRCEEIGTQNKKFIATDSIGRVYISTYTGSGFSGWLMQFNDSAYPIGIPIPYPGSTPPPGFALCNGQAFDKASYPRLASLYTNGIIPDLRGEFIRGWDNSRGIDSGRALLSSQKSTRIRNAPVDYSGEDLKADSSYMGIAVAGADSKTTLHPDDAVAPDGVNALTGPTGDNFYVATQLTASSYLVNWSGVRPRNVAYNYIIRMA